MNAPRFRHARCAALALAAAGAFLPAHAQLALTVSGTVDLTFGSFAAGSGGQVTVSPGGVRTVSGGVVRLSSAGGSAGQITVSGQSSATYSIGLPADGTVVLSNAAGQSMPLKSFVSSPSGSGQIGAGGSQTIFIGATLSVAAGQPIGSYSGSYPVSLNYN